MLKEIVYIDDICDTVETVEAKRLSEDNEIVLKNGGFQVKGWISNKDQTKQVEQKVSKSWKLAWKKKCLEFLGTEKQTLCHLTFSHS